MHQPNPHHPGDWLDEPKKDTRSDEARKRDEDGLRTVMLSRPGRRFIWRHLAQCGMLQNTFTGDALTGAFNQGQQNVAIRLYDDIMNICPDQFLLMSKEAREDFEYDNRPRSDTDTGTGGSTSTSPSPGTTTGS